MSSLLTAFVRGAPKAGSLMAGGASCARATRTRSVRMLSARPISGLSQVLHTGGRGMESRSSCPYPASALACPAHRPTQQQLRLLSTSETDENQDTATQEAGATAEDASVDADVNSGAASTAEETGEEGGVDDSAPSAAPAAPTTFLVQVDGIPFALTQGEVEQWFTDAGVVPIKVTMPLRAARENENKGRAYVELASEEDTQTAVSVSGRAMGERWVTVSRLATPLEECCSICIKGLKGISEEDLTQLLEEEVGTRPTIVRVIPENPARNQSGLAFADFTTPEDAQKALSLDGVNIMRRWIDVSLQMQKQRQRVAQTPAAPDRGPPFGADVEHGLVLMMKGLPFSLSDDEIMAFLTQYNIKEDEVVEMKVPKHNSSSFNTGVAFLHMKDEEAVQKTIALKGTYIGERWVDVAPWSVHGGGRKVSHKSQLEAARTTVPLALRKEYPDLPCVVVSGLPFSMSKEQFCANLVGHGIPESAVEKIEMPLFLQTQNNTGACWLVINEEDAYNRIMNLNGAIMDDRWLTIVDA